MEALNVLEKEKNIRKEVVLKAIEESLVQACKHHFGKSDNIVVNMDYNTGEYEINMAKEVVENVEDQQTQISLPNAKILDKRAVYGSTVYVKVNSKEFGRIAAQTAKHVIRQGIREAERSQQLSEIQSRAHDIVQATVTRVDPEKASLPSTWARAARLSCPATSRSPARSTPRARCCRSTSWMSWQASAAPAS